jgi:hypothetical protein
MKGVNGMPSSASPSDSSYNSSVLSVFGKEKSELIMQHTGDRIGTS